MAHTHADGVAEDWESARSSDDGQCAHKECKIDLIGWQTPPLNHLNAKKALVYYTVLNGEF